MASDGVNYYKGVLLCSRPNQSPSIPKQKPFCGRVFPHEQIGLVPTKNYDEHHVKKRVLPVLNNHKKWLEGFKKKIVKEKECEEKKKEKQTQKLQKIKQEAHKMREKYIKSINQPIELQKKSQSPEIQKHHRTKNKNEKPAWAKTENQVEAEEQKEVDDLLNFFEKGSIKDYLEDEQINKMLKDLKQRIEVMKHQDKVQEDWKKKEVQRIKQQKQKNIQEDGDKKDDILSRISRKSDAQSMASQKTAQRVQQLQKKKEQKQWDKLTGTEKKTQVSVDEQIAKNVADEVLRNYPGLKHHSNQSIRKLLEKHAREQIKA